MASSSSQPSSSNKGSSVFGSAPALAAFGFDGADAGVGVGTVIGVGTGTDTDLGESGCVVDM